MPRLVPGEVCPRCNEVHTGCSGHARSKNMAACRKAPLPGTTVCDKHGGLSPVVRAAGEARVLEGKIRERAQRELARIDVTPVEDPLEELSLLAGQAVAFKDAMAGKVNELTEIRYASGPMDTEQLRSEIVVWEHALDRCAAFLISMVKLGLDERRVRVEEARTELIADALREALALLGLSESQQDAAKAHVVRKLRAIG